jgi:propionate CoA-transferase
VRVLSAAEAVALIRPGQTVIVSGNGETLNPELLLTALEERFLTTGEPRGLDLVYNVIPGSQRSGTGTDHLAHAGLLRRVYAGTYYTLAVGKLNDLVIAGEVEACLMPFGALYNSVRCAAAAQPGFLTAVGVGTFVDPRQGGARLNSVTKHDPAEVMEVDGREYLFYRALPIEVALIRATSADEDGNLSTEKDPSTLGLLNQAMAARNRGGTVIAQVERVVPRGSLHPKRVTVPGVFVEAVVLAPDQMEGMPYQPSWTGDERVPLDSLPPVPFDHRKVIQRRAATELRPGELVNFGFGIGASVPRVAAEEGLAERVFFNTEHGGIGGVPNDKFAFGAGVNPMAIMDSPSIFDFYDAGRLDMTCLGIAEVAADGSVNVSHLGGRINLGGFMDIVHATPRLVFCGTFTSGGLEVAIEAGRVRVVREGSRLKFLNRLEQVTFSGPAGLREGQKVLYVTERAVFELRPEGLTLIEIAPGADLERDVLARMEYRPAIAEPLREMEAALFRPEPVGLGRRPPFS